jgi:hypothetical protein
VMVKKAVQTVRLKTVMVHANVIQNLGLVMVTQTVKINSMVLI